MSIFISFYILTNVFDLLKFRGAKPVSQPFKKRSSGSDQTHSSRKQMFCICSFNTFKAQLCSVVRQQHFEHTTHTWMCLFSVNL